MKFIRTKFRNGWYPITLGVYVLLQFITQLFQISQGVKLTPFINIGIVTIVIASVIFHIIPHIIVRVAGLVILLGGCLGLLSTFLFLISGNLDAGKISNFFAFILSIGIGFILYRYYDESVVDDDETDQDLKSNQIPRLPNE